MRSLLLTVLFLCNQLSAQTTFAPVGATWTYAAYAVQQFPNPVLFPATVTSIGDTIIAGTSCHALAVPELACYFMGFLNNRIYTYASNDSVYWYDEAGEAFRLIIPFNAQAGDEWRVPVTHPWQVGAMLDTVVYHVDSVSQVMISGTPLRKLFVTRSTLDPLFGLWVEESGAIIERLGDLLYLMPWLIATCSDGFASTGLVCYEDPEISWLNPQFTQCDLGVGVEEQDGAKIAIQPTVVRQGETILVTSPAGTVDVFDASGRAVSSSTTSGKLSLTLHRSGSYVLRLTSERGERSIERVFVH